MFTTNETLPPNKVEPLSNDAKTVTHFNGLSEDVKKFLSKEEDVDHIFATGTSLHGVGLISGAKSLLVKILWTSLLLTLSVILIWQILMLHLHFAKYSPVTEVRTEVSLFFILYCITSE